MFEAAFALGVLAQSFSGSFAVRFVSVCSVSSCQSRQIRSRCGALAAVRLNSHWIITINGKMNVWKCKLIFPTDTLQRKIEITDLKTMFSW